MNIHKKIISCWLIFLGFCFAQNALCESLASAERMPIRRVGHFPNDQDIEKGIFLKYPKPICLDNEDNITVGDWNYSVFYKVDKSGHLIRSFGKRGQGPKEFQSIHNIAAYKDGYVCIDSGNMRVVYLDKDGNPTNSFKIFKSYEDIATSFDGKEIYLPPRISEGVLIEVVNDKGDIIRSFGDRLVFKNKHNALNEIFLRTNPQGDVWAAWKYFPFIKRFSQKGENIAEYKIEDKAIKEIVKVNEQESDSTKSGNRVKLMGIINCFALTDSHYYIFLFGSDKPKIVEYAYDGRVSNVFEISDNVEKAIYVNMVVMEKNNEKTFYLVQGYPDTGIDIFRIVN